MTSSERPVAPTTALASVFAAAPAGGPPFALAADLARGVLRGAADAERRLVPSDDAGAARESLALGLPAGTLAEFRAALGRIAAAARKVAGAAGP